LYQAENPAVGCLLWSLHAHYWHRQQLLKMVAAANWLQNHPTTQMKQQA
jgi:hypothetical protein